MNTGGGSDRVDQTLGKSTSTNFTPATHAQYQATIEGPNGVNNDGISNTSYEDGWDGRHNSEEHIIHKDVAYEVRREN